MAINPELLVQPLPDNTSLKLAVPACISVSGTSGVGKSELVLGLVKHRSDLFEEEFERVIYCQPHSLASRNQSYINRLKEVCDKIEVHIGIPKVSDLGLHIGVNPSLLIVEDMMDSFLNSQEMHDICIKYSNHYKITCLFTLQNYYAPSKFGRSIMKNCQYRFLFYNRLEQRELNILSQQMTGSARFLASNFNFLFEKFPQETTFYLLLDGFSRSSSPQLFCRTKIFPNETPILFIKNPNFKKK